MEDTFVLSKEQTLYLYGAAASGKLMGDFLLMEGYTIEGFIDKRADEIEVFMGREVLTLDAFKEVVALKEDKPVVIIAVKNIFDHPKIASLLIQSGCFNLIYRPQSVLSGEGTPEECLLNEVYSLIENKTLEDKRYRLSKTRQLDIVKLTDNAFISENNTKCTAYVPIEMIFTDNKKTKSFSGNRPITTLLSHLRLFAYFGGRSQSYPVDYMTYCINAAKAIGDIKITKRWQTNVLENRQMIYEEMVYKLACDPNFFVANAPFASWNEKGYFNLHSGKHRAAFFVHQKIPFMPLTMTKDDYKKWINEDVLKVLCSGIEKRSAVTLKAPIPHPYFLKVSCTRSNYIVCLIVALEEIISMYRCEEKVGEEVWHILDLSEDDGCLARYFHKSGYAVDRPFSSVWEKDIDRLLYAERKSTQKFKAYQMVLDIGEQDSALYEVSEWHPILYITTKKSCPFRALSHYQVLFKTFWENKDTEVRVYGNI